MNLLMLVLFFSLLLLIAVVCFISAIDAIELNISRRSRNKSFINMIFLVMLGIFFLVGSLFLLQNVLGSRYHKQIQIEEERIVNEVKPNDNYRLENQKKLSYSFFYEKEEYRYMVKYYKPKREVGLKYAELREIIIPTDYFKIK